MQSSGLECTLRTLERYVSVIGNCLLEILKGPGSRTAKNCLLLCKESREAVRECPCFLRLSKGCLAVVLMT